jgi:hypothetical protein
MTGKHKRWPRPLATWQILSLLITLVGFVPPRASAAFTSSATTGQGWVIPGNTLTLTATVTSTTADTVHVQVYAYDEADTQKFVHTFSSQTFAANETKQLSASWAVPSGSSAPPLGNYRVKVGVFSTAWNATHHWNNAAAPFAVTQDPFPTPAASVLPTHLGIGVTATHDAQGLTGWMPQSSIPWDYAYTYMAGGLNHANTWQRWSYGFGIWPVRYAKAAHANNYIPVFSYYQLLQSTAFTPCTTCTAADEDKKDLTHLNDAQLMAVYFEDFKTLMKRLGPGTYDGVQGFGKRAIVHVEPDFSGYANKAVIDNTRCFGFCTGQGDDPSYLTAAVASTGVAELAGLPNTYQGYSWALLKLRDLYAPNVLLAFHVSNWSTGGALDSLQNNQDIPELARRAGLFAAKSGVVDVPTGTTPYNLIFNDVSDYDAGYLKYVAGKAGAFWDETNTTYPNYARWQNYLSGVLAQNPGKKAFIWQIPTGNQHFSTMNNTTNHYQDNRVSYFFANTTTVKNLGVVGLLFGHGQDTQTAHYDRKGDNTTNHNPAPACTSDGRGDGSTVCPHAISNHPDDDGGYLRMKAEAYYNSL